jgi:hypothetical protein
MEGNRAGSLSERFKINNSTMPPSRSSGTQAVSTSKDVSSTLEYLVAETVRHYREDGSSSREDGSPSGSSLRLIGEQVGRALAERLSTSKKPPLSSQLEIVKWVCKDFWNAVFLKSIDNLKTNHKGTYVLRDTSFRWTRRLSQNVYGGVERVPSSLLCMDYLVLPEAMVKGALAAFGLDATVTAETNPLPQIDFTIVIAS